MSSTREFYWQLLKIEEIDAINQAVDAITVTSSVAGNRLTARTFVAELAQTMAAEFYDSYPVVWHKIGVAKGWRKGSVGYATADNYNVAAITGKNTREAMDLILSYDGLLKCTRVDLCADIILKKPRPSLASNIHKLHPKRNDPTKLRLVVSGTGETLYINRRGASQFGRMYDKSADYGFGAGSGAVWRYEVQYAKVKAERILLGLRRFQSEAKGFVRDTTIEQFRRWDVPIPVIPDSYELPQVELQFSLNDARFDWLVRCSPAIRSIIATSTPAKVEQVIELLNLPLP